MSDEASSSVTAAAAAASAANPGDHHGVDQADKKRIARELADRRRKNRYLFNRKRGELLDDLLRNLDILIYAELSTIYYMDCFFFRFFMRAFVQFLFLTPKPAFFPDTPPNRPYVGAIFGSNLLCIILHLAFSAPVATEATRGYLHGGLAMDFIGQKGPTSKIHLVLLDIMVLVLQLAHLAGYISRQKLKDASITSFFANDSASPPAASQGQTVDDEERGVRRSSEIQRQENIELQTLNASGAVEPPDARSDEAESSDRAALLAPPPPHSDAHIFDAFNSGQIVLADLNMPRVVAEQFWAYQKFSWDATQTDPTRFLRQRLARGGLRWRFDSPSF